MRYRSFGHTDLSVSEICFNVSQLLLNSSATTSKAFLANLMDQAQAYGVNTFTADHVRNDFLAQEFLAHSFHQKRHQINLFLRCSAYDPPSELNLTRLSSPSELIRVNCEQSLRILKTDYLDNLSVLSSPTQYEELDHILYTLDILKTEGKIRSGGLSLDIDPQQPYDESILVSLPSIDSITMNYNMIEQQGADTFFQQHLDQQVGFIAANPHADHLFMDATDANFPGNKAMGHEGAQRTLERSAADPRLRDLQFIQDHHPLAWADLAITFCLANPSVTGVSPSISDSDQLIRYAEACEKEPPCAQCLSSMSSNTTQD